MYNVIDNVVNDKAYYHYDGDFSDGLAIGQAMVHIGMFLV